MDPVLPKVLTSVYESVDVYIQDHDAIRRRSDNCDAKPRWRKQKMASLL
jgi:hypothetical protein